MIESYYPRTSVTGPTAEEKRIGDLEDLVAKLTARAEGAESMLARSVELKVQAEESATRAIARMAELETRNEWLRDSAESEQIAKLRDRIGILTRDRDEARKWEAFHDQQAQRVMQERDAARAAEGRTRAENSSLWEKLNQAQGALQFERMRERAEKERDGFRDLVATLMAAEKEAHRERDAAQAAAAGLREKCAAYVQDLWHVGIADGIRALSSDAGECRECKGTGYVGADDPAVIGVRPCSRCQKPTGTADAGKGWVSPESMERIVSTQPDSACTPEEVEWRRMWLTTLRELGWLGPANVVRLQTVLARAKTWIEAQDRKDWRGADDAFEPLCAAIREASGAKDGGA